MNGEGIWRYGSILHHVDTVLCAGTWFIDQQVWADTMLTDTLSATMGDSIVVYNVTIRPTDTVFISLELCEGEPSPLTGTVYNDEGTFAEQVIFQNQFGCDSIVTATLTVHPEELLVVDNGPLPYGTIYYGVVLTQDTQFVFFDTTEFGCLLTISENVEVGPNAVGELEQTLGLNIFPNPAGGEFFIEMDLPRAMEMRIEAVDLLGRRVAIISENEFFQKGKQQLRVDARAWTSGIYLLHFQTGRHSFSKKIIKNSP